MKKMNLWGMGAAAVLGLALMAPVAHAQQKAPDQKPAASTTTPSTTAPASTAKTTKKAEKKGASVCKGLDEAACGANAACSWRKEAEIKKGDRKGQKIKAHCRTHTAPPTAKKKDAAPASTKAPAATTATPPPSSAGTPPAKK